MSMASSFASLPSSSSSSSIEAALSAPSTLLPTNTNHHNFLSLPTPSATTSLRSSLHLQNSVSFFPSSRYPSQLVAFAARTPSSSSSHHHAEEFPQQDEGAAAPPPSLDNQNNNGFQKASPETLSLPQNDSADKQTRDVFMDQSTPFTISHGNIAGGGTRAGLFRTPISGGVQSATSAHGLPKPALAVRNLMEQARFAHLCTVMSRMHHRREGYPFGSLVDFAPDSMGHPIFSFSPLAIHTRNLLADPRCTLVVQIPGWSGLSNARVTIFGDVYPLAEDQQEWAHKHYIAKHQQGPSQQWGNFYYFRMQTISDIYFIGGFGTVAWVDVNEYETLQPDKIAVDGGEQNLKELNATFSKPLKELLSQEIEVDDAALISIDSKGIDIRVRQGAQFNVQRISFEGGLSVETLEEAKEALWKLIKKGHEV